MWSLFDSTMFSMAAGPSAPLSNTTAGGAAAPPQSPLLTILETLIPGFSIISNLLTAYFNVDLTFYLWGLLLLLGTTTAANYIKTIVWGYVSEYLISTAEIRYEDEIYNYLMFWVARQGFSKRTSRFVAGTKVNSDYVYMGKSNMTVNKRIQTLTVRRG